jgi:signal transduction histidine kinase
MEPDRARRPGALTRSTLLTFLGLDLLFKVLVTPAIVALLGATPERRWDVFARVLSASLPLVLLFLLALYLLVRPVERALQAEALERAGAALYQLPRRVARAWSAEWFLLSLSAAVLNGGAPSYPALLLFCGALLLGPLPLAHSMMVWLTAPLVRRLSLAARERGLALAPPPVTLRRQLIAYSLCLGIAPTAYMASLAFSAHAQGMSDGDLLGAVLIYLVAVAVFAILCAALHSATLTRPIGEMTEILRAITRRGEVSHVGRVPQHQRDELGALGEQTNAMIDRLERTAAERQAAEKSLAELNRTLEQRVADRTAELAEANRELERAHERRLRTEKLAAIGQLAASVGHELRNPLGAVRNAASYIAKRLDAEPEVAARHPRVKPFLALIDRELDACAKIIAELLDFARERPLALAPCPLRPLVEEARALIPATPARVVNAVPAELPVPLLDKDQFRQVLINLLQNATEALSGEPAGEVVVAATGGGELPLQVSVADNGAGMTPEIAAKIFEPLFTTKPKGTGLGLAIVSNTVRRHGGDIRVESAVGGGTRFVIVLPPPP